MRLVILGNRVHHRALCGPLHPRAYVVCVSPQLSVPKAVLTPQCLSVLEMKSLSVTCIQLDIRFFTSSRKLRWLWDDVTEGPSGLVSLALRCQGLIRSCVTSPSQHL